MGLVSRLTALFLALFAISANGCSTRLNRFETVHNRAMPDTFEVFRAEAADQGSGSSASVGTSSGYTLTKTTVGGSYARRVNTESGSGQFVLSGGLHANPRAKK